MNIISLKSWKKSSKDEVSRAFMLNVITGRVPIFFMRSSRFSISRPSNHLFPLYSMLKKASIMLRLRLLPNLRGRVKRKTPTSS